MKPLDLLYVHASASAPRPSFFFMPAGVVGLLNELHARGFDALGVNEPLELARDPEFRLEAFVRAHPARLYAVDVHWHEHLHGALSAMAAIKRADPEGRVVVGGISATHFAHELARDQAAIDWVARGYAEGLLPRLLDALGAGEPPPRGVLAPLATLPDLDAPEQTDLGRLLHAHEYTQVSLHQWHPEWTDRVLWYRNGVGCASNCSFCGGAVSSQARLFGHKRVLRRSAERVAQDLVALGRQGLGTVALVQDLSDAGEAYLEPIFSAVARSGLRLGLYLEINALPGRAFLDAFARVFDRRLSTVALSPLSGDEDVRRRNGKRFTNEALMRSLDELRERGLRTALYFASGLPFETATARARTHLLRTAIERRFRPAFSAVTSLTLDPGSPMQRWPARYGVKPRLGRLEDYVERGRLRAQGRAYDEMGYELMA